MNLFFVVLFITSSIFTACKSDEPNINNGGNDSNSPEKIGILINGVVWSPYNVGATGKFVSKPEGYGGYYQWNRSDAANVLLIKDYFASDFPTAISWLAANNPCPKGWRVPTIQEFSTLLNGEKVESERITKNGINCAHFTDKVTRKSIFIPLGGLRIADNNTLVDVGKRGCYWSSTKTNDPEVVWFFQFDSDTQALSPGAYIANGISVRPVAE